jgi:hypothetical protein
MQRLLLAAGAVLMLLSAVAIHLWWPQADATSAFCWRSAALLAAAWLAYPDVQRLPNWLLMVVPVVLIVLVRWPRLLLLVIPLLIVLAIINRLMQPDGRTGGRR